MRRCLAWLIAGVVALLPCAAPAQAIGPGGRPVLTLPTDTRRALAVAMHELIGALPGDMAPVCLTLPGPAPAYWYSPEPRLLEELRTSAHRVVGPRQCPQTYDLMYVVTVDSIGRNVAPVRPPGYIDPHDVDVHTYQLLGADSVSLVAVAHQGTRNRHFECSARRDPGGAWRARCDYKGMSMSAVPPNEALQLTSARLSEGLRLSGCRDASASILASRILSRPLAAELWR
jgi:hypothetical protein